MKPENSSTNDGYEQLSAKYGPNVETLPPVNTQESNIDSKFEAQQRQAEVSSMISELKLTTALPTPVINTSITQDTQFVGTGPVVANDDDLIEKEWVDKAKKIVAETQNDPHQRENKVSQLQVDYIKKRFGRELGAAE